MPSQELLNGFDCRLMIRFAVTKSTTSSGKAVRIDPLPHKSGIAKSGDVKAMMCIWKEFKLDQNRVSASQPDHPRTDGRVNPIIFPCRQDQQRALVRPVRKGAKWIECYARGIPFLKELGCLFRIEDT